MSDLSYKELYKIVLDVIEPALVESGIERAGISPDTDLMTFLDSFGILDTILKIEENAGVSVDLAEMEIVDVMSISNLVNEIIRINFRK